MKIDKILSDQGVKYEIEENFIIIKDRADLSLYTYNAIDFPRQVFTNNDLNLAYSNIGDFPNSLIVGGSLNLKGTNIEKIHPKTEIIVSGNMDLSWSKIRQLPDRLSIYADLDLSFTSIRNLPRHLSVFGVLDLRETNVDMLPESLCIAALRLNDSDCQIKNIVYRDIAPYGGCTKMRALRNKEVDMISVGGFLGTLDAFFREVHWSALPNLNARWLMEVAESAISELKERRKSGKWEVDCEK